MKVTVSPRKLAKRERKLRQRLERAHATGDEKAIREARRAYMQSAAVRGAVAVEVNRKLSPPGRRVSDTKATTLGSSISWGKPIGEKVLVLHKSKPTGGTRPIVAYGLKNKTAQTVLRRALEPGFKPQPWQYEFRGEGYQQAILDARQHIQAGLVWGAELDIQNFYESFEETALRAMPVSQRVAKYNVLTPHGVGTPGHSLHTTAHKSSPGTPGATSGPGGLPQGSSLSPLVASRMVARLQLAPEIVALNWADNFLVLAGSKGQAMVHATALQSATSALPGQFVIKIKRLADAQAGIIFLGHQLVETPVGVSITPTQRAHEGFYARLIDFQARRARARAKGDKTKALGAMAAMWRYARGWCAAMRACDDIGDYRAQVRAEIEEGLSAIGRTWSDLD